MKQIDRKVYVDLLAKAKRYPLSMRIARDLWKSGVRLTEFEEKYHIEGNGFSKNVLEHMTNFHFERGGPDVDFVPTTLIRELKEEKKKGRPSEEEAHEFMRKVLAERLRLGWKEEDVVKAVAHLAEPELPPRRIKVVVDAEAEQVAAVSKPRGYVVNFRGDWLTVDTKLEAQALIEKNTEPAFGPLEKPEEYCSYCQFRLSSLVVTVREKDAKPENMHFSCYWMNVAKRSEIPIGMHVLDAPTGHFYTFRGINEGWEDETKKQQRVASEVASSSSSAADVAAAKVAATKKAGKQVHRVRRSSKKDVVRKAPAKVQPKKKGVSASKKRIKAKIRKR